MTLLPFGPIDVVAVGTLPVAERVRVVRRLLWALRCLVLRLHRRRRRRLLRRGHGRARRLTVRAASTVVPRLIRIIYAIAVLGPVHDSHITVADAAHVLAVFIITGAAAVLHRACCVLFSAARRQRWDRALGAKEWGWETRCVAGALARFCDLVAVREVAAMTREATSACATDWRAAAAAN